MGQIALLNGLGKTTIVVKVKLPEGELDNISSGSYPGMWLSKTPSANGYDFIAVWSDDEKAAKNYIKTKIPGATIAGGTNVWIYVAGGTLLAGAVAYYALKNKKPVRRIAPKKRKTTKR